MRIYYRSKRMKKMYALVVCMTVCGAALFAQTEADFATMTFDGVEVITKYKGSATDVVIPAAIGGKAIVWIFEQAFMGNKNLVSVTIPAGVTEIGYYAFMACTDLTSVTIPDSVTSVGEGAFYGCTSLKPEVRADIEKRFGKEPFVSSM